MRYNLATKHMGKISGKIIDKATGQPVAARVQVITSQGMFAHPSGAILKVGTGDPFFYADSAFEVEAERGTTRIVVERGTEYIPVQLEVAAPAKGTATVDIVLERWTQLGDNGWHPGNTHIHYDEKEKRPDDRLRLDPRVEDLRMTAVSILKRWDLPYATNKYPVGMLSEFSSAHHYVQSGEETRHNAPGPWDIGYGHVMLLNLRNAVQPMSRGVLVDPFEPDYPPLSYACDDTRRQGGIVIWCHNGQGMEAPVAAILGKVDAFNLFDPYWMDPEYDIYYRMLNAGIRLPASTGSDWYICSANRVYAQTGGAFEYDSWLSALKKGNTFITNGPALELQVDGKVPGDDIQASQGSKLSAIATWTSHYPVSQVELIANGKVIASQDFPEGSKSGRLAADMPVKSDGWIAARQAGNVRDSFAQPIFAHTSPVYVTCGADSDEKKEAAAWFDKSIETSLQWVSTKGRFYTDAQRKEVVDLFRQGQDA
ncbi:MAG: CehA/McbA family metallohydrolase [Chloroflexi bacterium]|nr:CehA/McbA family metallohydrolase [Chloroflexota bacterium]